MWTRIMDKEFCQWWQKTVDKQHSEVDKNVTRRSSAIPEKE